MRCWQHRSRRQAESSSRPLRRRAARIARPARVRMRRRKPWVLARRRLFGWNVRLVTSLSNYFGASVAHRYATRSECRARLLRINTQHARFRRQGAPAGAIRKAWQRYAGRACRVKCWTARSGRSARFEATTSIVNDPMFDVCCGLPTRADAPRHPSGLSQQCVKTARLARRRPLRGAVRAESLPRTSRSPPVVPSLPRVCRSPHTGCGQRCGSRTAVRNSTTRATTGSEGKRVITGRSAGPRLGTGGR